MSLLERYAGPGQMSFNWDESAHPRESAGTPKGGQFKAKSGGNTQGKIAMRQAKAGGEISPVTGEFYKGGHWMPVHGAHVGKVKPKRKPKVEPTQTGRQPFARERDPAQVRAEQERQQRQKNWEEIKASPFGDILGLGQHPHPIRHSHGIIAEWYKHAEDRGDEWMQAAADAAREAALDSIEKKDGKLSDADREWIIEDNEEREAKDDWWLNRNQKKLHAKYPGVLRARAWLTAIEGDIEDALLQIARSADATIADRYAIKLGLAWVERYAGKDQMAFWDEVKDEEPRKRNRPRGTGWRSGLDNGNGMFRIHGISEDVTICQRCGRSGLDKTIIVEVLDESGNGTGEKYYLGSECASQVTGSDSHKITRDAIEKTYRESMQRKKKQDLLYQAIADWVDRYSWDSDKHPRGKNGQFVTKIEIDTSSVKSQGKSLHRSVNEWALEHLRNMEVINAATGWKITIDRTGIKKASAQALPSPLALLGLKRILQEAELRVSDPPSSKDGNMVATHLLYHPSVSIDGVEHESFVRIREFIATGKRFYSLHAIRKKGSPHKPAPGQSQRHQAVSEPSSTSIDALWDKIKQGNDYYSINSRIGEAWSRERYAHRSHAMHAAKPTDAQAEAGNYRMAHISVQGLDITIETPKGRRRKPEWPPIAAHYGYVKRTRGKDGDHIDVFVGPDRGSSRVWCVNQVDQSGRFDEHKFLIAFRNKTEAVNAYRASYSKGWKVGDVIEMSIDQFKDWLNRGNTKQPVNPNHYVAVAVEVHRYWRRYDDDLRLDDFVAVDRYDNNDHWRQQPRDPKGTSTGGQWTAGNRPGGKVSDRILQGMNQRVRMQPGQPLSKATPLASSRQPLVKAELVSPASQQARQPHQPRSSVKRELAELPDTIKPGHELHHSALPSEWRHRLLDWNNRVNKLINPMGWAATAVSTPEEKEQAKERVWQQSIDKDAIRGMLEEMNQWSREAESQGIKLHEFVNANGIIPRDLAVRLDGGSRFFDPEKLGNRLRARASQDPMADALDRFRAADKQGRKELLQDDSIRAAVARALRVNSLAKPDLSPPEPAQAEQPQQDESNDEASEPIKPYSRLNQFDNRTRNRILREAKNYLGHDHPETVEALTELAADVWGEMQREVDQHNSALRELAASFNKGQSVRVLKSGKKVQVKDAGVSQLVNWARNSEKDQLQAFDEMVEMAQRQYPWMVHGKGGASQGNDPEQGLRDNISKGILPSVNPWDEEVFNRVAEMVGPGQLDPPSEDDEVASAIEDLGYDPNEPIPFSSRFDVSRDLQRYWNRTNALRMLLADTWNQGRIRN